MKTIFIFLVLTGLSKGIFYETLKLINDINILKLNHIDFDYTIFDASDHSDEDLNIVIEEIEKQTKPFGVLKTKRDNSTEKDCEKISLIVLPIDSVLSSNISCIQNQGKFIQNECETILMYSDQDISLTKKIYKKLECQLVDQPYVFLLILKNESQFELFEIQVITKRMTKLMLWEKDNLPK